MKGNAKIGSTMLGWEDSGIMTCFLHLEQPGAGQGFGGYGLDGPYSEKLKERLPSKLCGFWIKRVLETVGVSKWEDLKGEYVQVDGDDCGEIRGIGHITDNKWFYPKKEIKETFGD